MKVTSLRAVLFGMSATLILAAVGCTVDLGEVFSSTENNGNQGGAAGSGGGSGAQGGAGQGGQGAQGGASTSTTSSTTATTTTTTTTTATTTTSTTTTTTTTTSSGSGGGTLACGDNTVCERGGVEICCWNDFGVNGPAETGECQPANDINCNNELSNDGLHSIIECQDSSQCDPGKVCCGNRVFFNQTAFYDVVDCQTNCEYPALVLCTGVGDDANCPIVTDGQGQQIQTFCKASNRLPPGYFICATQ